MQIREMRAATVNVTPDQNTPPPVLPPLLCKTGLHEVHGLAVDLLVTGLAVDVKALAQPSPLA